MERRLAAVLMADIVGYSRLMEADELGVLQRQSEQLEAHITPCIAEYNGRVVKSTGDGFLAEFQSVVDAVNCAVSFQGALASLPDPHPDTPRILYRTGINIGDIIIKDDDIFGDGVNVAARLEAMAPPGGLCISELVWQNLRGALSGEFQALGAQNFKNIDRAIHAWQWPADADAPPERSDQTGHTPTVPLLTLVGFRCSARDQDAQELADGLITDLSVSLSKLDTMWVEQAVQADQVEAGYVIEGTVRTSGKRTRCTVQLRQIGVSGVLWADRFDAMVDDIFEFQDQITDAVVSNIEVELSDGQQVRRWRQEANDAQAYGLFQEGRAAHKEYSRGGNFRARALFKSALQTTPGFLSASVALARTCIEDANFGWSDDKLASLAKAREFLDDVLLINPNHPAAHAEMAHFHMVSKEFQPGILAGELAVAMDPNNADAHNVLAFTLNCVARHEDALHVARRAVTLNPGRPESYYVPIADACLAMERYGECLAASEQILARRPKWLMAKVLRILALDGVGRTEEAENAVRQLRQQSPRFTASRWRDTLYNPGLNYVPNCVACLKKLGLPG